jgi:hypothetical protein
MTRGLREVKKALRFFRPMAPQIIPRHLNAEIAMKTVRLSWRSLAPFTGLVF